MELTEEQQQQLKEVQESPFLTSCVNILSQQNISMQTVVTLLIDIDNRIKNLEKEIDNGNN